MAVVIRTDGSKQDVSPKNGTDFQFTDEAYDLIGASTIEIVPTIIPGMIMLIDEEGKLQGKPVNRAATRLYPYDGDVIVGDVLLCRHDEVR